MIDDMGATNRFAPRLLTNFASNAGIAEAYRIIRTGMLLNPDAEEGGTVLVTSTGRGEGKSLTCANLGIVLSRTDKRVVILDADLRLPTVHTLFGQAPGSYGSQLEDPIAAGDPTDPDWVLSFAVPVLPNLSVIPAGSSVQYPSELLESRRFAAFLATLRSQFDVVLIDSPPLSLVTDAAVLSGRVDGVLFVLDFQKTKRAAAKRAVRTLRDSGATILGSVVNRLPASRSGARGSVYGGA